MRRDRELRTEWAAHPSIKEKKQGTQSRLMELHDAEFSPCPAQRKLAGANHRQLVKIGHRKTLGVDDRPNLSPLSHDTSLKSKRNLSSKKLAFSKIRVLKKIKVEFEAI